MCFIFQDEFHETFKLKGHTVHLDQPHVTEPLLRGQLGSNGLAAFIDFHILLFFGTLMIFDAHSHKNRVPNRTLSVHGNRIAIDTVLCCRPAQVLVPAMGQVPRAPAPVPMVQRVELQERVVQVLVQPTLDL